MPVVLTSQQLHPLVQASIALQQIDKRGDRYIQHACGCSIPNTEGRRLYLCQYHEGMQDGIDAVERGSE